MAMVTFTILSKVDAPEVDASRCKSDIAPRLQVLREHRETLVSVMETFVHDPLCEWTKRNRSSEETGNPQAKDALRTLEGGCRVHAAFSCPHKPSCWVPAD